MGDIREKARLLRDAGRSLCHLSNGPRRQKVYKRWLKLREEVVAHIHTYDGNGMATRIEEFSDIELG